ncbi:MAG: hypothetical protein AMXMBFR44_0020 [Candidatus Campbellbacteria bacterium]
MKLTVQKEHLHNAVLAVERITGRNLPLPVLRCVLLYAEKNILTVRATNLDLGIEIKISADVEEDGVVAVPADTFSSLLGTLSFSGPIKLHLEGTTITVTTPKSTTHITTFSHEDFPSLPKLSPKKLFSISSKNLLDGLKSVWWSASIGSIKPELSSVYLYHDGGYITCVATDSFRLAEKKIKADSVDTLETLLIPLKNIGEMIRHLDGYDGTVTIHGDVHQIGFVIGDTYITSRAVEGVFPDYKQILPKEFSTEMTLLKQDFVDALKHVRVFSDQFNKLTVAIEKTKKGCLITSSNPETGEGSVFLDAAIEGDDLEMNFNYAYILDGLQSVGSDSVVVQFAGPGKPTCIRSVGDKSFLYIVMPMNR